jgi:hypothetical protein
MAHWKNTPEREDGDGHDETRDDVVRARQWLRRRALDTREPLIHDLLRLESLAQPFFLGLDYDDDDRDDVDEAGPF